MKSQLITPLPLALATFIWGTAAQAQSNNDLDDMSLDELLGQRTALHESTKTGSAVSETLRDAPAAMVVVTAQQIDRSGYDSLDDLVLDLPGFDTVVTNGTMQVVAYQRGYRTPWTQRTLVLINGRVDNHLWNQSAQLSRQYPINSIERVEVLYGPSAAVYGPNAFLGVINIITKSAADTEPNSTTMAATLYTGSFDSRALDLSLRGNYGDIGFSLGGRLFSSDEPDISDYSQWGYTNPALLSDPDIWGNGIGLGTDPATGNLSPAGDVNVDGQVQDGEKVRGKAVGTYYDPSDNRSIFAEINIKNWTLGGTYWATDEAYGPYYSFADGQPNAHWVHTSGQAFLNNKTNLNDQTMLSTDLVYRENRVGGDWIESFDTDVSFSKWNNFSSAWRFEQQIDHAVDENLSVSLGIKYEQKRLAKLYLICNYFDGLGLCPAQAENSSDGMSSDGSGVVNAADISSLNPSPMSPSVGERTTPKSNQIDTIDQGVFGQFIYDIGKWRVNAGVRWDNNSEYGSDINPRIAAIYHHTAATTFKLIYGEAFQEPSPKELYGEYNGRDANQTLAPEKARNLEFITIHQGKYALHDLSLYAAQYTNVIAGSENVGGRDIHGFEYRGDIRLGNPISNSADITGKFYYTYTRALAEQQFDNGQGIWVDDYDTQGDIAPHKVTLIVNLPIQQHWNFNLRGNWVSARELYSENPLRDQNIQAKAFFKLDGNLTLAINQWRLGLKVENILSENYLMPGVESASSGNDFSIDADGFENSMLVQVNKPIFTFSMGAEF
ncbi:TonB-dependent receptor plug domain-containing protein [Simiduia curdlanivorans]|uniref:TonB-dependent receptor plug domain-containing protein n=1 Tax=Simiduia curdlanivorans TaxID=1492769 RepID=A0ABV8V7X3_9GAMM|nr:TonB-dependent receptor [Simiduia curdlanivorans]MDN3640539.1 TonB-dependent receptor plug domain-containing protein [Simiduia curdlanivorans]